MDVEIYNTFVLSMWFILLFLILQLSKLLRAYGVYISQLIQLELLVCNKTFLIHRIPSTKLVNQELF
jgi:hypothetical protein